MSLNSEALSWTIGNGIGVDLIGHIVGEVSTAVSITSMAEFTMVLLVKTMANTRQTKKPGS